MCFKEDIPDLETVFEEDISIPSEFKIDDLLEFPNVANECKL